MRRLIINADDFGLTAGINRAILEAAESGVVTSTTLMASGNAFDHAVHLSQTASKLSVGCHIVLTDGSPILEAHKIPTLLENDHARFRQSLKDFIRSVVMKRLKADEIEAEATAQIRKLQSAGVRVTHFDSHKHTHLLPQVLRPLMRAARACGVRSVRNPLGPVRFSSVASRPKLWKRYGQVKFFCVFARKFRESAERAGLKTPDGTVGIVGTGVLDEGLFHSILDDLPHGTWEFVCHPGYNDADLASLQTRLRESRLRELRVLTAPSTQKSIARNGIELISYEQFASLAAS